MKVHQEKQRPKFRISLVILFIVASFVFCFVMYMRGDVDIKDVLSQNEGSFDFEKPSDETAETQDVSVAANPVPESDKRGRAYFDTAVFIGDTQMKGLSDYDCFPADNMLLNDDFTNSGINSSSAGIKDFLADKDFEAAYFMIGMNDLDNAEKPGNFDELGRLFGDMKNKNPEVKIYCVSLLPVTEDNETGDITNAAINAYNKALLAFADDNGVYYIDVNSDFAGDDGKLPDEKTESSGYRLKRDSYTEISDFLLKHTV